jgi:uncharacterized membrane protein
MNMTPFLDAGFIVQSHVLAALMAVALGPVVLLRPRRDRLHRSLGTLWFLAMGWTALSSFGITSMGVVGPFSPIHLLSILTLRTLWYALARIRAGDITAHRIALQNLYWRGLLIAGLFTLMPGRMMAQVVLGDRQTLGWLVIALGLAAILGPVAWRLARAHFALERPARLG